MLFLQCSWAPEVRTEAVVVISVLSEMQRHSLACFFGPPYTDFQAPRASPACQSCQIQPAGTRGAGTRRNAESGVN